MTAVDRLGFHVRVKTPDGMRGARIAFSVSNPIELGKGWWKWCNKLARKPNELKIWHTFGTPTARKTQ